MSQKFLIFVAMGLSVISSPSWAWEFRYHKAERAGEASACTASDDYNDGWFSVRLFGEEMDFILYHEDLTLPFSTVLGTVSFSIGGRFFILDAQTVSRARTDLSSTSQTMYLTPRRADYEALFDALVRGGELNVGLPNGDGYRIDLIGSARALRQASECWKQLPTGRFNNNPFQEKEFNNPFSKPSEVKPNNPFREL